MDKTITTNLCRGLRACGVSKQETLELVNTIEKWYDHNGPDYTNSRLKDLKQWYETYLAGHPEPPAWFKHSKDNMPVGIWSKVFKHRNPAMVLGILSMNTCFKNEKITLPQRTKFLDALNCGALETRLDLSELSTGNRMRLPDLNRRLSAPSYDCITGKSIPVSTSKKIFLTPEKELRQRIRNRMLQDTKPKLDTLNRKEKRNLLKKIDSEATREAVKQHRKLMCNAYCESWESVPIATLDYLRKEGHLELVPPALLTDEGYAGTIFNVTEDQTHVAGSIGCIQQEALKARWIANPNRVTQSFLTPLGEHWYSILRSLPTDCTFDQEMGTQWVQQQLKSGVTLAGADLSSATDLLDRELCLRMITQVYLGRSFDKKEDWTLPVETSYRNAIDHFMEISSMDWVYPEGGLVNWDRGQPLGTYPSFAMLGLTNNALGRQACLNVGISPDSFRVIGDDIIIDQRALSEYVRLIELCGGSINHSKTLTSDRCAEFAGRVITPQRCMNKTVKYKDMSDNSFMQIVSDLGDQAKHLLRPRQRHQYEEFKYVPGIVVDGPYSKNSFGIPLYLRYAWYLEQVQTQGEPIPEKDKMDSWQFAQEIYYFLSEEGRLEDFEYSVPFTFADDFQSSLASNVAHKGDPRLRDGKTCLEALEAISSPQTFMSFKHWIESEESRTVKRVHESAQRRHKSHDDDWER